MHKYRRTRSGNRPQMRVPVRTYLLSYFDSDTCQ